MRFFLHAFSILMLLGVSACASQPSGKNSFPVACGCAPPSAPTFLMFFDWDKSKLKPEGIRVIAMAAAKDKQESFDHLYVSGFTDTSGSPGDNQKLGMRRPLAVRKQLIADGVSRKKIIVKSYGDTHLLIPTRSGVRSPQNRRVEVVGE